MCQINHFNTGTTLILDRVDGAILGDPRRDRENGGFWQNRLDEVYDRIAILPELPLEYLESNLSFINKLLSTEC
jgi:hypothetical protein